MKPTTLTVKRNVISAGVLWVRVMGGLMLSSLLLILVAFIIGGTQPRQTIVIVSARENTNKIYLLDIARRLSRKLSDLPVIACCPLWSPDGQQIAFLSVDAGAAKIFLIDWDGRNLRRLTSEKSTNEGSPAWSPDSQHIAFVFVSLLTSRSAIFVADVEGGDIHPLAGEFANDFAPVWSPDGAHILFSSDLSANGVSRLDDTELFTIRLDGSGRQQLTNDAAFDSAAAYSPDGTQLVFTSTPSDYFPISIYRMNADGSGRSLITDHKVSRNIAPAWSPDGKRIVFLSGRDGDVELYAVDADGKNTHQLTVNRSPDWLPNWSADGRHILFLSGRDGDSAVYLMDAQGDNPLRLTPYPANDSFAGWQPGGIS